MRLSKFLAEAGVASRRKAEEIILEGRVKVNGDIINELGIKIDPEKDKVTVDAKSVNAKTEKVYYLLNKPAGYTTTVKDPHAEHTVMELLPENPRVFPVGRLDKGTTGLLIMTNDGELAYRLTHPKFDKEKEYLVSCASKLTLENIRKLEDGVPMDGRQTKPAKIRQIHLGGADNKNTLEVSEKEKAFKYSIVLKEGKKRQIRRMFEHIGHPVLELKRIRIDDITLADLREGEWRRLEHFEVDKLFDLRHNEGHMGS